MGPALATVCSCPRPSLPLHPMKAPPPPPPPPAGSPRRISRRISVCIEDNSALDKVADQRKGYLFMALLALQFGGQPLLTSEFVGKEATGTSIVVTCEFLKFWLSLGALTLFPPKENVLASWSLASSCFVAGLPAVVYAFQNIVTTAATRLLEPLVFNCLNQTKILWTSVFLYLVMGRKQTKMQIAALMMLMGASVILSLGKSKKSSSSETGDASDSADSWFGLSSHSLGVLCVTLASLCSGMAAALTEKALAGQARRNAYLFTMELCVFSLLALSVSVCFSEDGGVMIERGFFHGWDRYTILSPLNNALGGIITGQLVRYAGAVKKGFSVVAALIFTAIAQRVVYGSPLRAELWAATPLVVVSLLTYSSNPYTSRPRDTSIAMASPVSVAAIRKRGEGSGLGFGARKASPKEA